MYVYSENFVLDSSYVEHSAAYFWLVVESGRETVVMATRLLLFLRDIL
jgi:hypothetical protein